MKYENTLKSFRQYVGTNYPNKEWFSFIKPLYALYHNEVIKHYSMDAKARECIYDEKEAKEALSIYCEFYNVVYNILYCTYGEALDKFRPILNSFSSEEKDEFSSHVKEGLTEKGLHFAAYMAYFYDHRFYHVCTFTDYEHVKTLYFDEFLEELFDSDDDVTKLFLETTDWERER